MSEETNEQVEPTEGELENITNEEAGASEEVEENGALEEWKKQSRKWEKLAKENLSKLQKLEQNGEESTSLEDRVKELEAERNELQRTQVALAHGLPKELAARLSGSTVEELEEDARLFKSLIGISKDQSSEEPEAKPKAKRIYNRLQGNEGNHTKSKVSSRDDFLKTWKN